MLLLALSTVPDLDLKSSQYWSHKISPHICLPDGQRFPLVLNHNIIFYSLFSKLLSFCPWTLVAFSFLQTFLLKYCLSNSISYACHCKTSNLQEAMNGFLNAPPSMSTHIHILLWLFWEVLLFHHGKRITDLTSFPQSEVGYEVEIRCQSPKVKQSAVHLLCEMAERQGSWCEQVMPSSIFKHWRPKKKVQVIHLAVTYLSGRWVVPQKCFIPCMEPEAGLGSSPRGRQWQHLPRLWTGGKGVWSQAEHQSLAWQYCLSQGNRRIRVFSSCNLGNIPLPLIFAPGFLFQ